CPLPSFPTRRSSDLVPYLGHAELRAHESLDFWGYGHSFLSTSLVLEFDFNVDVRWQVEAHKRVNSLWSRVYDVDKTLVSTHFKVLTAIFVFVRRTDHGEHVLLSR